MESEVKAPTEKLTVRCLFCNTWNRIEATKVVDGPKCGKCAKRILLERPFPLNDETFARTIAESDVPVAVDFYADWCGPCRMMAPAVDALAASGATARNSQLPSGRCAASTTRTVRPSAIRAESPGDNAAGAVVRHRCMRRFTRPR